MRRDARQLCTRELVAVRATMPAREALQILVDARIHAAPVVRDDGRAVGVVAMADLVGALGQLYVSDRMSSPTVTVEGSASVQEVARAMADHQLHHLVVVDQGKAIGFLSALDVIAALVK